MVSTTICESVGVVIKNEQGEYLAVKRKLKPLGWGLPAAHIIDEKTRARGDPGDVIRRVVLDETGIRLINIYQLAGGGRIVSMENGCRRGFKTHFCYLYGVRSYDGVAKVMKPEKHERVEFVSAACLKELEKNELTDPVWFKFILPDLRKQGLL